MKIGSLFSGIGGFELALEAAIPNAKTVWQVEIDSAARAVLAHHWPNARRYHDVREVSSENLEPVDIIAGGFPCQDVSMAGRKAGLREGTRSGLWIEFARIVGGLLPRFVAVENVNQGRRLWLPIVLADLEALGYRTRAFRIAAEDVGAWHERARVFVVGERGPDEAPDPDGVEVRERAEREPRRREDSVRGEGEAVAAHDGDHGGAREASDAHGSGLEVWQGLGAHPQEEQPTAERGDRESASLFEWSPEPDVVRVVHGFSSRLDRARHRARIRLLGNAIVPKAAELVGRYIAMRASSPEIRAVWRVE